MKEGSKRYGKSGKANFDYDNEDPNSEIVMKIVNKITKGKKIETKDQSLLQAKAMFSQFLTGMTKAEFDKNYQRVKDIVDKSASDVDKAIALSQTQANRISDEFKAINRAMAAKSMKEDHIFEVFFQRAYELGSVSKQEYREYQLSKLGI